MPYRPRFLALGGILSALSFAQTAPPIHDLRITLLSTMLADSGIGEWGFAALVESGSRRILFDTGRHPDTVLRNVRALKLDLAPITEVILSHNHSDHTGGLTALRREFMPSNAAALSKAWVARGIFYPRLDPAGADRNPMTRTRAEYEALGGRFSEIAAFTEIFPGAWLTGPVPRKHPERNWSGDGKLRQPDGVVVDDNLPEDMSLVFVTARGLVILSGCGHSGIVNTVEAARAHFPGKPLEAALGGFHLFDASPETLQFSATRLRQAGLKQFLGAHCTGIETVYELRRLLGLSRKTASVGAVGSVFTLAAGLDPGAIAH